MITDPTGNYSASSNMFGFVSNHMINDCLRIPSNTSTFSNQLLTVIGTVNAFDMFRYQCKKIYIADKRHVTILHPTLIRHPKLMTQVLFRSVQAFIFHLESY